MSASTTQAEKRLSMLLDEREVVTGKWEALNEAITSREDKTLNEVEQEHILKYRERVTEIDAETTTLTKDIEATNAAIETARLARRAMAGVEDGVEQSGDGIIYRDFATFARDTILSRTGEECSKIAQLVGQDEVLRARERLGLLQRTPANTLSSNVAGLQTPQFIDQIFQIINKNRNLVNSAQRTTLNRGTLTYPKVSQRPVVAVQGTQKTEAGNQGMVVDLVTANASTYLGGGDLSWQAINWSTPDALQLWFDLAAADYALKTEQDAAKVLTDSAYTHHISTQVGSTDTFAQVMTGLGAGYAAVFANSGRVADTVYIAPDRFGYFLGLTSNAFTQFQTVSGSSIGPLNIVISRGLDAGTIIVGDSAGLLVAETAGAPVELRVVEPAIGGVEVGIIGAFEADVVDDGEFALITTAS
jgi:HK97 family phage major capsid protein